MDLTSGESGFTFVLQQLLEFVIPVSRLAALPLTGTLQIVGIRTLVSQFALALPTLARSITIGSATSLSVLGH